MMHGTMNVKQNTYVWHKRFECIFLTILCFIIFLFSDNSREISTEVLKSTRDMYGKSQKERMDNLDQANQEIDRLRKQLDKLQVELQGNYWQREKENEVLSDKLIPVKWYSCWQIVSLDTSVFFSSWNFYQFLVTFHAVYLCWICMRTFLFLVPIVPSHSAYRFLHGFPSGEEHKNVWTVMQWLWIPWDYSLKKFIFYGCNTHVLQL